MSSLVVNLIDDIFIKAPTYADNGLMYVDLLLLFPLLFCCGTGSAAVVLVVLFEIFVVALLVVMFDIVIFEVVFVRVLFVILVVEFVVVLFIILSHACVVVFKM